MTPRARIHARLRDICGQHKTTLPELLGCCRMAYIVAARRDAARFLVREEGLSLPHAGRMLNRDHTTVVNLLRPKSKRLAEAARLAGEGKL